MEIHKSFKVMVSGYGSLLVISSLVCISSASICIPKIQYLNTSLQKCVNCTQCPEAVLRPCEIHRDSVCGPVAEIINFPTNHHRHKHLQRPEQRHRKTALKHTDAGDNRVEDAADLEITSTEAPFSSAETLVWDWQAIALSSAVFACFLFFLAITLYSLHQAKQWRRLKDNFDAGKAIFRPPDCIHLHLITCFPKLRTINI
jgi:hypothetical protein